MAALAALLFLGLSAAQACDRASVSGANRMVDPGDRIDAALLDAAIRVEVNYHRCKAGLAPLKAATGLRRVAETHAKWMAKKGQVTHKSTVAGQATLRARLSTSGVKFKTGAENVGMVHRFQIDGGSFRITDASACAFATNAGKPIPAHSYGSLARLAVSLWMASPGHRANILNRNVKLIGSAAGFDASAPWCGQFYLSQNFAG
jgi:uncharacterized protein YkwD